MMFWWLGIIQLEMRFDVTQQDFQGNMLGISD